MNGMDRFMDIGSVSKAWAKTETESKMSNLNDPERRRLFMSKMRSSEKELEDCMIDYIEGDYPIC